MNLSLRFYIHFGNNSYRYVHFYYLIFYNKLNQFKSVKITKLNKINSLKMRLIR